MLSLQPSIFHSFLSSIFLPIRLRYARLKESNYFSALIMRKLIDEVEILPNSGLFTLKNQEMFINSYTGLLNLSLGKSNSDPDGVLTWSWLNKVLNILTNLESHKVKKVKLVFTNWSFSNKYIWGRAVDACFEQTRVAIRRSGRFFSKIKNRLVIQRNYFLYHSV